MQHVHSDACPRGRVRKHAVGPCSVQGCHILLVGCPAQDLNVRAQPTAVDRQIDVHIIVAWRDDHSCSVSDSNLFQDCQIRGTPVDILFGIAYPVRLNFNDAVVNVPFLERTGGRSTDTPASEDDELRVLCELKFCLVLKYFEIKNCLHLELLISKTL